MTTSLTARAPAAPGFGTARHPFRATLPARVLRRLPSHEPEVAARMAGAAAHAVAAPEQPARRPLVSAQDVKDFLIAYIACFLAVSAFLS